MNKIFGASTATVTLLAALGCASIGDQIPIKVATRPVTSDIPPLGGGGVTVAVGSFVDSRADRSKLGTRQSIWGTHSDFVPQGADPSVSMAQALTSYLAKWGWQAQYVVSGTAPEADVLISGIILDLSVNAEGTLHGTEVVAKNKLVIQAKNRSDGSSITETVSHAGSYHVLWFEQQDGEDILGDVLEKNFARFLANTRVDGKAIRFR